MRAGRTLVNVGIFREGTTRYWARWLSGARESPSTGCRRSVRARRVAQGKKLVLVIWPVAISGK